MATRIPSSPGIDAECRLNLLDELSSLEKRQCLELVDNLDKGRERSTCWRHIAQTKLVRNIRTSETVADAWAATRLPPWGLAALVNGRATGLEAEMRVLAASISRCK